MTIAKEESQDNVVEVNLLKTIKYEKIRCLVLAAYYMGQEAGLERRTYNHMIDIKQRERLIELILKDL